MSIEVFGIVAGTLGICSYMPQVLKVIKTKQTRDLSVGMWIITVLALVFWIIYAALKESPTLLISNAVLLVMAAIILFYKLRFNSE